MNPSNESITKPKAKTWRAKQVQVSETDQIQGNDKDEQTPKSMTDIEVGEARQRLRWAAKQVKPKARRGGIESKPR